MTLALAVILAILFAILGFVLGIVFGAGIVLNRIRDYRDNVGSAYPYDVGMARVVIGDLLTFLEGERRDR